LAQAKLKREAGLFSRERAGVVVYLAVERADEGRRSAG